MVESKPWNLPSRELIKFFRVPEKTEAIAGNVPLIIILQRHY